MKRKRKKKKKKKKESPETSKISINQSIIITYAPFSKNQDKLYSLTKNLFLLAYFIFYYTLRDVALLCFASLLRNRFFFDTSWRFSVILPMGCCPIPIWGKVPFFFFLAIHLSCSISCYCCRPLVTGILVIVAGLYIYNTIVIIYGIIISCRAMANNIMVAFFSFLFFFFTFLLALWWCWIRSADFVFWSFLDLNFTTGKRKRKVVNRQSGDTGSRPFSGEFRSGTGSGQV